MVVWDWRRGGIFRVRDDTGNFHLENGPPLYYVVYLE
jgi:hypothetical protein